MSPRASATTLRFGPAAYRRASLERRDDADALLTAKRHVISMYVSGVAAECTLRALNALRDKQFDDRHDLREMCRTIGRLGLLTSSRDDILLVEIQRLQAVWRNALRYASDGQVSKFLGRIDARRYRRADRVERAAKDLFEAAASVVARGEVIWHRSKKR